VKLILQQGAIWMRVIPLRVFCRQVLKVQHA
jgi:hypothetical protein